MLISKPRLQRNQQLPCLISWDNRSWNPVTRLWEERNNLKSLDLWSACSLEGELQWVINYETITQCQQALMGTCFADVLGRWSETYGERRLSPLFWALGKEPPTLGEHIRQRDRSDLDLEQVFQSLDLLCRLGTQNLSMPRVSMYTRCLISGSPEDDIGPKAWKVTSKPSRHRTLVMGGPL